VELPGPERVVEAFRHNPSTLTLTFVIINRAGLVRLGDWCPQGTGARRGRCAQGTVWHDPPSPAKWRLNAAQAR